MIYLAPSGVMLVSVVMVLSGFTMSIAWLGRHPEMFPEVVVSFTTRLGVGSLKFF